MARLGFWMSFRWLILLIAGPFTVGAVDVSAEAPSLLLVGESEPWMAAVAAPLATRQAEKPVLLTVSQSPPAHVQWLLKRLQPTTTLLLAIEGRAKLTETFAFLAPKVVALPADPLGASAELARQFSPRGGDVLAAELGDPKAVILAGVLAVQRKTPLLVFDRNSGLERLIETSRQLVAAKIVLVAAKKVELPQSPAVRVEALTLPEVESKIVETIGRERIRNVVVARVPDARRNVGATAWLAPYWSAVRGSAVWLTGSGLAEKTETQCGDWLREHRLQPKTITLLADYESIGTHREKVAIEKGEDSEISRIHVEPFMPTSADEAARFGVGRIPLRSLGAASAFFARGIVRDRLIVAADVRALVVANPKPEEKDLPLCELISRTTVQEFQNFGISVDDFYRQRTGEAAVLSAAARAHLILFAGHIEHQEIFQDPRAKKNGHLPGEAVRPDVLEGVPIAILQSCESSRPGLFDEIYERGGVGLLGSDSPIHSASGAAFAKAFCDAALYRNATLGEAIRDAKNYFGCLDDYKKYRGFAERAKSQRVMLAFRLWADPELTLFAQRLPDPRLRPVEAELAADGSTLAIKTPRSRFPEVRSNGYTARLWPGAEAAGVVRPHGDGVRELTPFVFGHFAMPHGFEPARFAKETRMGGRTGAVFARIDEAGQQLYVLAGPKRESKTDSKRRVPASSSSEKLDR